MFSGSSGPKKKVSLGGRSAKAENRDDLLEKAKVEREKRRREKLEDGSARLIQARGFGAHPPHS
jgi:hypothetical protein